MESTLSSSPAKYTLKKKTCSPTLMLSRPFPPSCAAFPPLLNSFTSLRFLSISSPFACISISPSAGGVNGGGTGGEEGLQGGDSNKSGDVSALSPDVIVLHITGMMCGGCAASVERILESQPQVSSASVNLTTETAIVWPVPEAKSFPNWRKQLGELLAKHLSSCGFTSNLGGDTVQEGDTQL